MKGRLTARNTEPPTNLCQIYPSFGAFYNISSPTFLDEWSNFEALCNQPDLLGIHIQDFNSPHGKFNHKQQLSDRLKTK